MKRRVEGEQLAKIIRLTMWVESNRRIKSMSASAEVRTVARLNASAYERLARAGLTNFQVDEDLGESIPF